MEVSRNRFIDIKLDRQVKWQIITIHKNGEIEISRQMWDVLHKNRFSLQIRDDSRQLLLDPEGKRLVAKKDEPIIARNLIEMIDEKVAVFPMNYRMKWDPSEKVWIGDLQTPVSLLAKRREELLKG